MLDGLMNRPEGANAADIRTELQEQMFDLAFVVRSEQSLTKMQEILEGLHDRFERVYVQDTGKRYNTELMEVVELGFLLECADALAAAALARDESRGGTTARTIRLRDDANWLRHSLAYRDDDGSIRLEHKPVNTGTLRTHGTEVLMAATASGRARRDPRGFGPARRRRGPHRSRSRSGSAATTPRSAARSRGGTSSRSRLTPTTGCSTRCTRSSGTTTGPWRSGARARTASAVRTR
jgi:hypothetical protein